MPSGAGVAGFGGGFASGLASALLQGRQASAQKKAQEEARKDRLFMSMLPTYLQNVESPADLESVFTERFPELFGGTAGKAGGKKKTGDGRGPMDMISHFLGPLIGGKAGATQQPVGNDLPSQGGITGNLPGRALPMEPNPVTGTFEVVPPDVAAMATGAPPVGTGTLTGTPAAAPATAPTAAGAPTTATRRTLFGVPLMTEEEKIQRDVTQKTETESRLATARVDVARRLLPQLQAIDKSVTLEDALRYVASGTLMPDRTGVAFQSVAGEIPDPEKPGSFKSVLGVFDRELGQYIDPNTRQPLVGFRKLTTTGSVSLGSDREALAREKYGKPASALTAEEMAAVNAELPAYAQKMSLARGRGSGQAKIETDLKAPIGPTAAALYNVPPTTTLGELSQTNTLRADQQERIASLGQVDQLLDEITAGLTDVFPEVEPGVWGRIQTQFALGMKKLAGDDDLATLDASINAALAQVAQLSGQPGSRLSDNDIKMAKSTLAELTPKLFGGDTLRTAQARVGVVRRLLDKAKMSVPPKTVTPGAPGNTTAPPAGGGKTGAGNLGGAVIRDGKLYVGGVEVGAP